MLTLEREDEEFILETHFDTAIPVSFEKREGEEVRIHAFPSVAPLLSRFEEQFGEDPFTDAALAWLWEGMRPYLQEWGYHDDRFRDRWGYVLSVSESTELQIERIQPHTRLLTASDEDMNDTTYDLEMSIEEGRLACGSEIDGRIVSVAVSHDKLEEGAVPSVAEVGVETVPAYRGRGLAVSNLVACTRELLRRGVSEVEYRCQRYNSASLAVAERAGFQRRGKFYHYVLRADEGESESI